MTIDMEKENKHFICSLKCRQSKRNETEAEKKLSWLCHLMSAVREHTAVYLLSFVRISEYYRSHRTRCSSQCFEALKKIRVYIPFDRKYREAHFAVTQPPCSQSWRENWCLQVSVDIVFFFSVSFQLSTFNWHAANSVKGDICCKRKLML